MHATTPRTVSLKLFLGVVLALLIVNAIAFTLLWRSSHRTSALALHVDRFEIGKGDKPTLTWHFNRDVVQHSAAPVKIEPALAGTFEWPDARTLRFRPNVELPVATEYRFTLPTDLLRGEADTRLSEPHVSTFRTSTLQLLKTTQVEFDAAQRLVVDLEFNDTVNPADVVRLLTATLDPTGQPVRFHNTDDQPTKVVRLRSEPIWQRSDADANVLLTLAPGLRGNTGPLASSEPCKSSVRVFADRVLLETSLNDGYDSRSIDLDFNGPVDVNDMMKVVTVQPTVAGLYFTQQGERSVQLRGDFRPATRYAVTIAPRPEGSSPRQFPRPDVQSVLVPDLQAGVQFNHDAGYLGVSGRRTLGATVTNLRSVHLKVYKAHDANIATWRNFTFESDISSVGNVIVDRTLSVDAPRNTPTPIELKLDQVLPPDARGDGIYLFLLSSDEDADRYSRDTHCVVTLSDLALTAHQGDGSVTVWATSLSGAKPVAGVTVQLYSQKNVDLGRAVTNADGLATLLTSAALEDAPSVIVAQVDGPRGRQLTWLDLRSTQLTHSNDDTSGRRSLANGRLEAFLWSERDLYRPGETVRLRSLVRGERSTVPASFPVEWRLLSPDGRIRSAKTMPLDADAASVVDFDIPQAAATGKWRVELGLPLSEDERTQRRKQGTSGDDVLGSYTLRLEDFMPQRLKVRVSADNGGTTIADTGNDVPAPAIITPDKPLTLHAESAFLFGSPASELTGNFLVTTSPEDFIAKDYVGWTFADEEGVDIARRELTALAQRRELPFTLDAQGRCLFAIDQPTSLTQRDAEEKSPESPTIARARQLYRGPWRLNVLASVFDVGGRPIVRQTSVRLDTVVRYLGLRRTSASVQAGDAATIDLALVNPLGQAMNTEASVDITLYQVQHNNRLVRSGSRTYYESTRELIPVEYNPVNSVPVRAGRGVLRVTPPHPGTFVVAVRDPQTGVTVSTTIYCRDRGSWDDRAVDLSDPEHVAVRVESDRSSAIERRIDAWSDAATTSPRFRNVGRRVLGGIAFIRSTARQFGGSPAGPIVAGDRVRVDIDAPFAGTLLLTVEADQVRQTRVIQMAGSHTSVPLDLDPQLFPTAYVCATIVRPIDTTLAWRTHRAYGLAAVKIDDPARVLATTLEAPEQTQPESPLNVRVKVVDAAGKPAANTAVVVSAVDEGILTLTDFRTPDPIGFFAAQRRLGTSWFDAFSRLMPDEPSPGAIGEVGGDGISEPRYAPPVSAKRVKPVSKQSAVLRTDATGYATATFDVPQFAGKLRLMAVTYRGNSLGRQESNAIVSSPLVAVTSWPRFAAPGDSFDVPVRFMNTSKAPMGVRYHIESKPAGMMSVSDTSSDGLALAPGEAVQRIVHVKTNDAVGVAQVTLVADTGEKPLRETIELPIRPLSPRLSFGGAVTLKGTSVTTLTPRADVLAGIGELHLRVAPKPSLRIPEGLDELNRYPYGCLEQTVSAAFPLVYLADIGSELSPDAFSKEHIDARLRSTFEHLQLLQARDGGLVMWVGDREPNPYATIYAAHFLATAEQAGYVVPPTLREGVTEYLKTLVRRSGDSPELLQLQAYTCHVLALMGQADRPAMTRLTEMVDRPVADGRFTPKAETRFHLAAAWLIARDKRQADGLLPEIFPAPNETRLLDGTYDSPVRERAVLLSTLLTVQPDHPAIPGLVEALVKQGETGHWRSTQDTAWAVLALGQYYRATREQKPYDTVELWQNGVRLARAEHGKELTWTVGDGPTSLAPIEVRTTGPADAVGYATWLQDAIPTSPPVPVTGQGIDVVRRYTDREGRELDLKSITSGSLVYVDLAITAKRNLPGVAIEDLLPAGLEIENPNLTVVEANDGEQYALPDTDLTAAASRQVRQTRRVSVSKQPVLDAPMPLFPYRVDRRDDRVVLFANVAEGTSRYRYIARAVSSGEFRIAPVRAECMYDVATRSITGGGTMTVVAPAEAAQHAKGQ
ncbi:MAG: MG2 domain-containing protein [Tepidisphaeraceae bacterium]